MTEQFPELPGRPRVLLLGDASLRPEGLERALTRAGFQPVEQEDPETCPTADAVLITLAEVSTAASGLLAPPANHRPAAPRLVILTGGDPEGPAAALALGAADALLAPLHLPELCARLHARIRENRPPAAAGSNGRPEPTAEGESEAAASRTLEQRVSEEFERARRYSLSFSLILLGVDELQDSDQRLREEVADTLRSGLRVPDLVASYGPNEFAIVLPETGSAGARQSLVRVRERLTSLPFQGDPRFSATRFSAGIVTFPHPAAQQAEDLFAMAEAALSRGRAQSIERIGVAV